MKLWIILPIILIATLGFVAYNNTVHDSGSLNLNNLGIEYAYAQSGHTSNPFQCEDGSFVLFQDDCPENQSIADKIRNWIIDLIFRFFGDEIIDYFNPIT